MDEEKTLPGSVFYCPAPRNSLIKNNVSDFFKPGYSFWQTNRFTFRFPGKAKHTTMASTTLFSRPFSTPRRILTASILLGLLCALIIGSATALWLHHKRQVTYTLLVNDIRDYMSAFFDDLAATVQTIQPLVGEECQTSSAQLTHNAAFNVNVRAFLLVREGVAYCSSATGEMHKNVQDMVPVLKTRKLIDLALISGTPMLPTKPAIAVWYRHPHIQGSGVFATLNLNLTPFLLYSGRQRDISGTALIVGDKALTTFSPRVIPVNELSFNPVRKTLLRGYPMAIWLFGDEWAREDIMLAALAGIVSGLLFALACGTFLFLRQRTGKEILTGISRGQFYPVYQPVINAGDLRTTGVEVLMRWQHPTAGMIPPDAFVAFAEAQNLIAPLTRHLFTLIAADAPTLSTLLPKGSRLSVNLAPGHLHAPEFKDDVLNFSASLPEDHFQVVFEITERDMLKAEEAPALFDWLHRHGFEIAVDDFGTGHSALIYLERFKLDYLKIDRGFVNTIGQDTVTAPVLDAVLTLAERLDMTTIAEGVETQEQAKWLIERGVNYLQGYLFSRPLTLEQLSDRDATTE